MLYDSYQMTHFKMVLGGIFRRLPADQLNQHTDQPIDQVLDQDILNSRHALQRHHNHWQ